MKKVFSLFLSAVLLLTSFGLTAAAAAAIPETLSDKLTIDYYGGEEGDTPFSLNVIESLDGSTQRFSDDNRATFAYGPEELLGATYLQPSYSSTMNSTIYQNNTAKWMVFTLKAPATVYYFTSGIYVGSSFQQYVAGWLNDGWSWVNDKQPWYLNATSGINGKITNLHIVKKEIEASAAHPVTIQTTGAGSQYKDFVHSFAIQWKDISCDLSGITVGGKPIIGFAADTTEYSDVAVESLDTEIVGTAVDSAAQVMVSKPASLPGDATITVEKDGKSKVYTLHLIQKELGKFSIDYYGGWYADKPFDLTVIDRITETTKRYSDEGAIFTSSPEIPSELMGATYLQPVFNSTNTNSDYLTAAKDWVTVTLREPATVYYLTTTPNMQLSYQNFLNNWIKDGWTWMTTDGQTPDVNGKNAWILNGSTSWTKNRLFLLKKDINASAENPVTIKILSMGSGGNNVVSSVAFQWKSAGEIETKSGEVTNIQTKASVAPNLVKGFGSGTRRWQQSIQGWQYYIFQDLDGFSVDSENSYYLQTSATQESDSGFNQDISEGWLSFDINRSANIYVLLASDTFGNATRYPGLSGWEKLRKENGDFYCMYTENCPSSATMSLMKGGRAYIYKKSFTLPSDGLTTQNISLSYGGTSPYGGYNVIVEVVDNAALTVSKTGEGTVTPSGTTEVIKGSTQAITATPADGWKVESVMVNGVPSAALESFSVTVDGDTTVEVTFAELPETPPTLTTFENIYVPVDKASSVTFGTIAEGNKTIVKEYGVVYSASDSVDPQIGKDNCYKLKAEKSLSVNGHYGIEIKGNLLQNTTYHPRTYMIYEREGGTEEILYGEIKTIALQ